jgi:hypothetical protein
MVRWDREQGDMPPERLGRRSTMRRWAAPLVLAMILGTGGVAFGLTRVGPSSEAPPSEVATPSRSSKARVVHVAPSGSDRTQGSAAEPMRTIEAAIKESNAGDTIMLHAGTYREELKIENRPGLKLVAAPGDKVWLDGSVVVPGWTRQGDRWVSTNWTNDFDSSPTYSWGKPDNSKVGWSFLNPKYPMAAHPDQVWVDEQRQLQVGSKSEVKAGTFFVDTTENELWLGSDPTGHTVTASAQARALRVRSAGMLIRGIGFRKYAPSVPHMGTVTVEAPKVVFDRVTITDNATSGMHVLSSGVKLRDVAIERNGMMGLTGTESDDLELTRVSIRDNNIERFNQSPAAGGVKIGRSARIVVQDSVFADNLANGLWFDESVYDIKLLNSRVLDNAGHGVSIEISGKAIVMGNVIARNRDNGLKVNNSEDVQVWNNTFADNNRSINVVQDDRDLNSQGSFRDPDLPLTWRTQTVVIRNNVISRTGAVSLPAGEEQSRNCLLCVEDFSGRWTAAEMDVTALGNVYHRASASAPKWIVVWARRSKDPYVFRSVAQFNRTAHQEDSGVMYTGRPILTDDLQLRANVVRKTRNVAQPLPEDLAKRTGRAAGAQHLGAWISG